TVADSSISLTMRRACHLTGHLQMGITIGLTMWTIQKLVISFFSKAHIDLAFRTWGFTLVIMNSSMRAHPQASRSQTWTIHTGKNIMMVLSGFIKWRIG